ncbi:MAG TPA: ADP-ribosylglycohydrolase family protein [Allosphingosinicella sp.]|nr:ADP-ribosylglycohydrolase family protein [Allosphingosinicella sp.]
MLGAIAGDIIGSRLEGEPAPPPGFVLFHPLCRFTDDSVCSLAVADALLSDRDYAASLRAFVRRHPRRGYGAMFRDWALVDGAPPYGSWGNGAPMRTAAVGWLEPDEATVLASAAAQAAVSHDHPDAIAAAQAVALAIFLLRQGTPPRDVRDRIARQFGYDLNPATAFRRGGFDISAAGTVPPALAAAFETADWETAVRTAIGLGGDTDTLACIAGAAAEAIHGVPGDIAAAARMYLTGDLAALLRRFEEHRERLPGSSQRRPNDRIR